MCDSGGPTTPEQMREIMEPAYRIVISIMNDSKSDDPIRELPQLKVIQLLLPYYSIKFGPGAPLSNSHAPRLSSILDCIRR
jgi:hypothetical protein